MCRYRVLGVVAAATVVSAGLLASGGLALAAGQAIVTCPTVSSSGTVTPAPKPGVDWQNCSLTNADLSGANLTGANLENTYLTAANLSDANLSNANLTEAVFTSATLSGAKLTGAILTGAMSGKITGTPAALPVNWDLVNGYLLGPGANVQHGSFPGLNLTGADLAGALLYADDFTGANLSGADFANAQLVDITLTRTDISGANLDVLLAEDLSSGGVTASPTTTLPQDYSLLDGYLMGPYANLDSADLAGLDLSGIDLQNASLTGADISGTALGGATLTDIRTGGLSGTPASLPPSMFITSGYLVGPGVGLEEAVLSDLNLAGADLAEANLGNATLTDTDLAGANLAGATIEAATLSGADLSGANVTGVDAKWAVLSGADLSGADFSGADLEFARITSANLNNADLAAANLTDIMAGIVTGTPAGLPAHWEIVQGYLLGPTVVFPQGADLKGVNFSDADLEGAGLDSADLSSATLIGTDFRGTQLFQTNFQNSDLSGANLSAAYLDGVNLTDADLSGASLASAGVVSTNLSGANFANADFDNIGGASNAGTPAALPPHFFLVSGYLVGPTADLFQANLQGDDLRGYDLSDVNFETADLSGANLDDTNLTGADLRFALVDAATFTGVRWRNTICPDGTNSNSHDAGCFSPLDTTPPKVTVTGVKNGKVYVSGGVPAAGCKTTDTGTVTTPATLTVTTTGKNGVGRFTATCSGAVDLAGNKQKAPVSVRYTVAYGLHGFLTPANGSTIARSSKTITARLRLTNSSGSPISYSLAEALAAAGDVLVTLRGPGIKAVTVNLRWNASRADLTATIRIPSGVRTGSNQHYTLTVTENVGTGLLTAPGVRGTADPVVVHFK